MAGRIKVAAALLVAASILAIYIIYTRPQAFTVPRGGKYGIYMLDLSTNRTTLIYGTDNEVYTSALRLNSDADSLVFAQKTGGSDDNNTEIYTINVDGKNLRRLTSNNYMDLYPVWSADGSQIAFISKRVIDLDIYVMSSLGGGEHRLFDSSSNDADIDWVGDTIVYTSKFKIWSIRDDGSSPRQLTNPPDAGRWGSANLPVGDYDPRLSRDGGKIVFERLEDPDKAHGSYDLYSVNVDGTGLTRLTETGNPQGLANWSHDGERITYVVAAINGIGKYDIYMIDLKSKDNLNITPSYFPPNLLCYSPTFTKNDSAIYFIGQWIE